MIRSTSYAAPSFALLYCPHSKERYTHTDSINDVIVIDSETLASCGDDGKVILWKINPEYITKPHDYIDFKSISLIYSVDCAEIKYCKLHTLVYDQTTNTIFVGGTKGYICSVQLRQQATGFVTQKLKILKSMHSREICHLYIIQTENLIFASSFDHKVSCSEIFATDLIVPICCWSNLSTTPIRYMNFIVENSLDTYILLSTHNLDGIEIFSIPNFSTIKNMLTIGERNIIIKDYNSKTKDQVAYINSKKYEKEIFNKTDRCPIKTGPSLGSPRGYTPDQRHQTKCHLDHPRQTIVDNIYNVLSCDHDGNILMFNTHKNILNKKDGTSLMASVSLKQPAPSDVLFEYGATVNNGGVPARYNVGTWWAGDGRIKVKEVLFDIENSKPIDLEVERKNVASFINNSINTNNTYNLQKEYMNCIGMNNDNCYSEIVKSPNNRQESINKSEVNEFDNIKPEMSWKKYLNGVDEIEDENIETIILPNKENMENIVPSVINHNIEQKNEENISIVKEKENGIIDPLFGMGINDNDINNANNCLNQISKPQTQQTNGSIMFSPISNQNFIVSPIINKQNADVKMMAMPNMLNNNFYSVNPITMNQNIYLKTQEMNINKNVQMISPDNINKKVISQTKPIIANNLITENITTNFKKISSVNIPFSIKYGNTGKIRSIAKADMVLASAGEDHYVIIWNIVKQVPILKIEGGLGEVMGVKFWNTNKISPIQKDNQIFNGVVRVMITYGKDGCLYVWAIRVE